MYRGHRIAQMLLAKEQSDEYLLSVDRAQWYHVDHSKLASSPQMNEKWHQFYMDRETEQFLEDSFDTSNAICLQVYYALASAVLSMMMSKTSINGVLNRGGMFIFSTQQFHEFMRIPDDWDEYLKYMLDLGAGDGRVTSTIANFYKHVAVTEASQVMEWRLRQRGYKVIPMNEWTKIDEPLDLVCALNLLDRHYNPMVLLNDLYRLTSRTNSLLLIAVVLPIRQYVEFHPNRKTNHAEELSVSDSRITVEGETFEEQATSLVEKVFEPAGFELVRWGKLPYLCEGDHAKAYYKLDDAIFLLKPNPLHQLNSTDQGDSTVSYESEHSDKGTKEL
ncbi:unnamed protein product [Anisakis simplex]|uniref:Methyltransferase-like protein 9 (inferred by orthology to a human protein) n=1 Tax=Anisakis simplex TaxID=6269 RepID=A0A158PNU3_ANISI|nr:unnamed protein product [Anisakis simplex]